MKERSLIIGANSFIGSYLARAIQPFREVTGVYHQNTDRLPAGMRQVSVEQLGALETCFREVYIVSAFIQRGKWDMQARRKAFRTNVELVGEICEKFAGSRIILCSSVSVYNVQEDTITEQSSKGALNEYGVSKLWSEKIVAGTDNFAILRFSSVFGAGMNMDTILPQYAKQALEQKEITVYGEGKRLQNYLHVQDAAGYLWAAANSRENGEFLACAPESISNLDLARLIAEEAGSVVKLAGEDHSPSFIYNNTFTAGTLKYHPGVSMQEGVKEIIKWIKNEF